MISLGLIIPLELVRNTDILFLLITKLMYEAERMLVFKYTNIQGSLERIRASPIQTCIVMV